MTKLMTACASLAMFLLLGQPSWGEERAEDKSADPRTPEEVVPGIPLDGLIIVDESVWVTLIGEPGRHMTNAYKHLENGRLPDAAESIHRAASFLYIASDNALEGPDVSVQKAAVTLDDLRQRVAKGDVKSADELKPVFSNAHLAMSRHHASKAADAFARKHWSLAGNYLSSSASHLRRASYWAGKELRSDTQQTLSDAKQAAGRLVEEGGKSVGKAGQLIETLGKRIEQFGESLADRNSDDSDTK